MIVITRYCSAGLLIRVPRPANTARSGAGGGIALIAVLIWWVPASAGRPPNICTFNRFNVIRYDNVIVFSTVS